MPLIYWVVLCSEGLCLGFSLVEMWAKSFCPRIMQLPEIFKPGWLSFWWKLKCCSVDSKLALHPLLICPQLWNLDDPSNLLDKYKLNRYFLSIHSVPGSLFNDGGATGIMMKPLPSVTFSLVGWPLPYFENCSTSSYFILIILHSFTHSSSI